MLEANSPQHDVNNFKNFNSLRGMEMAEQWRIQMGEGEGEEMNCFWKIKRGSIIGLQGPKSNTWHTFIYI